MLVVAGNDVPGDQASLARLLAALWRGKWLMLFVTLAFVAAGAAYAWTATSWYRAQVLLAPADEQGSGPLPGQLGGLVSLAGLSRSASGTAEAIGLLGSAGFTRAFIEEEQLLPLLYAAQWDSAAGRWHAADPALWPDVRDAVDWFDGRLRDIREDTRTGLVTLTIEWTDPELAAQWANGLVARLNALMRDRALAEAEANVAYLREELAATTVITLQQSIGRLLEAELQKLMLARGTEEFAFRVLDPASAARWPSWPNRPLILALAFTTGLAASLLLLFLLAARGKPPARDDGGTAA